MLLPRAYNSSLPPFRKGGWGGFEGWEHPPKSSSAKGDFKAVENKCREKIIIRCELFYAPLNKSASLG